MLNPSPLTFVFICLFLQNHLPSPGKMEEKRENSRRGDKGSRTKVQALKFLPGQGGGPLTSPLISQGTAGSSLNLSSQQRCWYFEPCKANAAAVCTALSATWPGPVSWYCVHSAACASCIAPTCRHLCPALGRFLAPCHWTSCSSGFLCCMWSSGSTAWPTHTLALAPCHKNSINSTLFWASRWSFWPTWNTSVWVQSWRTPQWPPGSPSCCQRERPETNLQANLVMLTWLSCPE